METVLNNYFYCGGSPDEIIKLVVEGLEKAFTGVVHGQFKVSIEGLVIERKEK